MVETAPAMIFHLPSGNLQSIPEVGQFAICDPAINNEKAQPPPAKGWRVGHRLESNLPTDQATEGAVDDTFRRQ